MIGLDDIKTKINLEKTKLIINARGTKIEVPHDSVKGSNLINTWFQSLDEKEKPEIYVNFSAEDVNKFLDFVAYNFCTDDKKISLLCAYFDYKTNVNPNNSINVTNMRRTLSGQDTQYTIRMMHKFCKPTCVIGDEYNTRVITFTFASYYDNMNTNLIDGDMNVSDVIKDEINRLIKKRVICPNKIIDVISGAGTKILRQIADIIIEIYDEKCRKV